MKTFKIKDLNVSVGTGTNITPDLCHNPTVLCNQFSCGFISNCYACTIHVTIRTCYPISFCNPFSNCGHVTYCACSHLPSLYDPTRDWITTTPVQNGIDQLQEAELTELKNSLGELQKAVEVRLQRSPQELDELESKLTEALEEVRSQKANAKKK